MNIVLYDEVSSQLSQSFFDNLFFLCGIAVTGQIQEEETIVNRSLSQSELNLLLKLNSSEATDISQRIGDFLVQEVIPDDTKVGVNSEVAELIAARHGDDISWVNRTFFDGRNAIQLELDNYPQTTLDKAKDYPDSETLLRVLLFTIDLNDRVSKEVEYFLEHHDYFDKMPDGRMFDNLYYFLNNKDVLLAGFNPLDHFTKYGEAEGRAFRTGRRE